MKNFCFYKLLQMELNHFPHFFSSAPVTSTFSLESSTSLSPILSSTGRTCSLGPRKLQLYIVWSLLATQPHPVPHFLSHFPSFGHIRRLFYCPNLCLAFLVALSGDSGMPSNLFNFHISAWSPHLHWKTFQNHLNDTAFLLNPYLAHRFFSIISPWVFLSRNLLQLALFSLCVFVTLELNIWSAFTLYLLIGWM